MEIDKKELDDILKSLQLIQSSLLVILSRYEETQPRQHQVNEPLWASTGTGQPEQSMVHTVTGG